jgi:hydrogenase expression/formation protein HypE
MKKNNNLTIKLDHGAGGFASWELLKEIRKILSYKDKWKNCEDDAAVFNLGKEKLVFTTDAFIVDPIFFPGGDIGKIAISGTINDLAVMGAKPLGISLSMVIEEGFSQIDLIKIIKSIDQVSREAGVPVVTGDTKVMEKGKIDKIEITTAGIGITRKIIQNNNAQSGDFIITSGDLGEHSIALLSKRFNYQTKIKSDAQPFNKILEKVGSYLNACKDPTRGGLAANIVEIANKSKIKIILDEKTLPYKKETIALTELLGIDIFSLASEGRFIASVSPKNINKVLKILKRFNPEAKIIGEVKNGKGVFLKTNLGSFRPIEMPKGKLIPRIC